MQFDMETMIAQFIIHFFVLIYRRFRYTAYKAFTRWIHGWTGKGYRIPLPACASHAIRIKFPEADGHYTGFISKLR